MRIIKLYVSSAENWPTSKSSPRVVMMVYEPKKSTNTITVYRQNCISGAVERKDALGACEIAGRRPAAAAVNFCCLVILADIGFHDADGP